VDEQVGVRRRGNRLQSYLNRSEAANGEWTALGTHPLTQEGLEQAAAREQALQQAQAGVIVDGES
jgi:hypothetical protein